MSLCDIFSLAISSSPLSLALVLQLYVLLQLHNKTLEINYSTRGFCVSQSGQFSVHMLMCNFFVYFKDNSFEIQNGKLELHRT